MQVAEKSYFPKKEMWGVLPRAPPTTIASPKSGVKANAISYDPFRYVIYVSDEKGLQMRFAKPKFSATSSRLVSESMDLGNDYIASIAAMYVATSKCGVRTAHLNSHADIPNQITSIMRYHVTFTFQRLMEDRSLLSSLLNGTDRAVIYATIPGGFGCRTRLVRTGTTLKHWLIGLSEAKRAGVRDPFYTYEGNSTRMISYTQRTTLYEGRSDDYLRMIPSNSEGITPFGLSLMGKSFMMFTYCVIGAQANTGEPIVGKGSVSLVTQERFGRLHGDFLKALDITNLVKSTKLAIEKVGVNTNRDIIPGFIRIPDNMVMFIPPVVEVTETTVPDTTDNPETVGTKTNRPALGVMMFASVIGVFGTLLNYF